MNLDFRELSGSHHRNKSIPITFEDVGSELQFMQNKNKMVDWSKLDLLSHSQFLLGASASNSNDALSGNIIQFKPDSKMVNTRAKGKKNLKIQRVIQDLKA